MNLGQISGFSPTFEYTDNTTNDMSTRVRRFQLQREGEEEKDKQRALKERIRETCMKLLADVDLAIANTSKLSWELDKADNQIAILSEGLDSLANLKEHLAKKNKKLEKYINEEKELGYENKAELSSSSTIKVIDLQNQNQEQHHTWVN